MEKDMLNAEEAIEKWTKFESRANSRRSTQVERIKDDRSFLSGEQWETEDDGLIPAQGRGRRTVNVLANAVACTVNGFATYPYKWYSDDGDADALLEAFWKFGSNARAAYDVLYNEVAFGLGYFSLGSETVIDNGEELEVPALYSIEKVENVYWDPDSVEYDGRDACECGIVEYKSKEYVENKYGPEFVAEKGTRAAVNTTANQNSETMCIVTYFRMEDGRCQVYRLLNDRFLDEPVTLEIPRIPVFPAYGERTFSGDDTLFQGIVRKGKGVQKLLNYAFTQLAERMAQAPKPTFMTPGETVEDLENGYKDFMKNLNPLLIYNRLADDGKTELPPPVRIDNTVQFGDITAIIQANLELMSTITGVDPKGLMSGDTPQVTATEVLYNERQQATAIRHYYANLRDTFKAVGDVIIKLFDLKTSAPVETIQGPDEYMEKQIARSELMTLGGMVGENDKMKIVDGILKTHGDNAILRDVYGELHRNPAPTPMEQQAFDTIEQMKQALDEKNQQLQQLQETIRNYENQERANDKSNAFELEKMKLDHTFDMENEILKAQLAQGTDADRERMANVRQAIEVEKAAIALDTAKVNAETEKVRAATDMFRAAKEVNQPEEKNEDFASN